MSEQIFQPTIYTVTAVTQTTAQIMLQGNASVTEPCTPCPAVAPGTPSPCPLIPPGPIAKPSMQFTAEHAQESHTYGPGWDGAVGSCQFLLASKARVRSFCKNTPRIDNILNVSYDKFFGVVSNGFLSADPNVLFDQKESRWYLLCDTAGGNILFAMSDGMNNGQITSDTVWSFFIISNTVTGIPTYANSAPDVDSTTLGYDENSVLLAGRVFDFFNPFFLSGAAYVLPKKLLFSGEPTVYAYLNLTDQATKFGPDCTQAATNFDAPPQAAYFLGINTLTNTFPAGSSNFLFIDRVPYDANGMPTVLIQTPVPVLPFSGPIPVFTQGSPKLVTWVDAEVSRGSHIRNGQLLFAQNISVNPQGESGAGLIVTQNAARYYRIDPISLAVKGIGTLFDPNGTSYTTPSLMSNINGDVIIGATIMGPNHFLDATAVSVPLLDGEFTFTPPPQGYTTSITPYFTSDDWELMPFSRWGDHSRTTLDTDGVTFWTAQGWCIDSNTWATQVATITSRPS